MDAAGSSRTAVTNNPQTYRLHHLTLPAAELTGGQGLFALEDVLMAPKVVCLTDGL